MLNQTINETINITASATKNFFLFEKNFWVETKAVFFDRSYSILEAPFKNSEMLWMLLPLLTAAILLEFYFGRYKEEELGWNTAFGNSLILFFVSIDLFRYTISNSNLNLSQIFYIHDPKIIISFIVFIFSLFLMLIDFFHIVPKKIAYALSSPAYIHLLSLLGIIIVYSKDIPLDWITLISCIIILALFTLLTHLIYLLVPSYHPPLKRIIQINKKN